MLVSLSENYFKLLHLQKCALGINKNFQMNWISHCSIVGLFELHSKISKHLNKIKMGHKLCYEVEIWSVQSRWTNALTFKDHN